MNSVPFSCRLQFIVSVSLIQKPIRFLAFLTPFQFLASQVLRPFCHAGWCHLKREKESLLQTPRRSHSHQRVNQRACVSWRGSRSCSYSIFFRLVYNLDVKEVVWYIGNCRVFTYRILKHTIAGPNFDRSLRKDVDTAYSVRWDHFHIILGHWLYPTPRTINPL